MNARDLKRFAPMPANTADLEEAIWWSCSGGDVGTLDTLLSMRHSHGLDLNKPNAFGGATPLYAACHYGRESVVETLITLADRTPSGNRRVVDPNLQNPRGNTPLWAGECVGVWMTIAWIDKRTTCT